MTADEIDKIAEFLKESKKRKPKKKNNCQKKKGKKNEHR